MCLIANSDGFMLAGFLKYHIDFISSICFDESSSFGEQSNKKKSDIPHFITGFFLLFILA